MLDLLFLKGLNQYEILFFLLFIFDIWGLSRVLSFGFRYFVTSFIRYNSNNCL